ncbi:hypothetical protein TIFTF001_054720, partial [Ficus carica]
MFEEEPNREGAGAEPGAVDTAAEEPKEKDGVKEDEDVGFEDEEEAVLKAKEKEGVELGFEDDPNENLVEAA